MEATIKNKKWKMAEGQVLTFTHSMGKEIHSDELHCLNHTAAAITVVATEMI